MGELVLFVSVEQTERVRGVGAGWTGDKSRCRGNFENVVVDNVSCLPDLAQGTPYMRAKPLH